MKNIKIPNFVYDGAFNWTSKGYHYVLSKEELQRVEIDSDENPWYFIAHIVELAKRGDFTKSGLLSKFFDVNLTTNAAPVAMLITGDIGRDKDLKKLLKIMQDGPDGFRIYACRAAANSGCLWLIPHMLEAWHLAEGVDAHENIGYAIADLLDPIQHLDDIGPIASKAGNFTFDSGRHQSISKLEQLAERTRDKNASSVFHEIVMRKYSELKNVYKSGKVIVWGGKAISVSVFAQLFIDLITSARFNMTLSPLVVSLRQKFEAATGIDCSTFFQNGRFRQIIAVGVLEGFLNSGEFDRFKEESRYFFGHIIPE